MFSTVPFTSTELPFRVSFDPTPILREQAYSANHTTYDPETSRLTFQQDRKLTRQVEFVFPTRIDGYTVEVELEFVGVLVPIAGSIVLPPLSMYGEHVAEVRFSALSPTEKPPRPKMKTFIRVQPTGGG